jgi:hypothetical protein
MSHEEIADAVGSAREVVSRHLARFQADEMLALERAESGSLIRFGWTRPHGNPSS